MENQNYVARAKALMLKTARTTALVIVPLAAAVSAHAGSIVSSGAILPISNLSCSFTDAFTTSGSCTSSVGDNHLASQTGIQGASFFTTSPIGFSLSSGSTSIQLMVGAGGPLSGNLNVNDPVGFAFSFLLPSGGSVTNWSILLAFGNAFGNASYGSYGFVGTAGSGSSIPESGSGTILVPGGGIASGSTFWETTTINAIISGGSFLQISVPGAGTFDFNSVAASSVPEPASIGLMGSGLALLGYLFRRRRRKA